MNVVSRGCKNALRSPLRSGAIVVMLAISTALILSMLVARSSVNTKIDEIKASTATTLTINPAGIQGGFGGGDPLTATQVATIKRTAHVSSVAATLTDQLGTSDTNLTPSLELGSFGQRAQRFESSGSASSSGATFTPPADSGDSSSTTTRPMPTPRTRVTGTNSPASSIKSSQITSGTLIDGNSTDLVAMVGKSLAEKNSLKVGSTFTAYTKTFTVKAIFSTGNTFEDSGIIMPIATLQTATNQAGAVTNVTAIVDSADNVATTVASLKTALADKADITSQADQATTVLEPLQNIAGLATGGVIAAAIAGSVILLLTMIMIVRERRKEIGVIKAIGGTNFKVITQFISEAVTLTVVGAVVGLAMGVFVSGPLTQSLVSNQTTTTATGISAGGPRMGRPGGFTAQLTSNVKSVTSTLTPSAFAMSIGIILLVAMVGSGVPAWFISRIKPAEVLRGAE